MFCIRSSDLIHLIAENLYSFIRVSLIPSPSTPGSHFSTLCLYESDFFFGHPACGILAPQSGMELVSFDLKSIVEAQSLNYWTAREVPGLTF